MTGERYKGFSIPEVLEWYLESTGLSGCDYLFPRFRNDKGRVVTQGGYWIGYSSSALQLKNFCVKNQIPVLTMHSGRRGGVTLAVDVGIDKMSIQNIGNWSSNAVDGYFHPRRAGVKFSERALKRL